MKNIVSCALITGLCLTKNASATIIDWSSVGLNSGTITTSGQTVDLSDQFGLSANTFTVTLTASGSTIQSIGAVGTNAIELRLSGGSKPFDGTLNFDFNLDTTINSIGSTNNFTNNANHTESVGFSATGISFSHSGANITTTGSGTSNITLAPSGTIAAGFVSNITSSGTLSASDSLTWTYDVGGSATTPVSQPIILNVTPITTSIPEPSTYAAIFGIAALALGIGLKRNKRVL